MAADLVLGRDLRALGAEGLRVDGRSILNGWVAGRGQAERDQGRLRHEFDAVGEFIVKVGQGDPGAPIPELLIDASIVGAGGLRPRSERRDTA